MGPVLLARLAHEVHHLIPGVTFKEQPLYRNVLRTTTLQKYFKNDHFTKKCSGLEAGSYLRFIDFVYQSTLVLRVIKKRRRTLGASVVRFDRSTPWLRLWVPRRAHV